MFGATLRCPTGVVDVEFVEVIVWQLEVQQLALMETPELVDVLDVEFVFLLERALSVLGPEMQCQSLAPHLDFLRELLPDVAEHNGDIGTPHPALSPNPESVRGKRGRGDSVL